APVLFVFELSFSKDKNILNNFLILFPALLTVEMTKTVYTAQYGSNVSIECKFSVGNSLNMKELRIYWQYINQDGELQLVSKFENGEEQLKDQNDNYRERAHLLTDKLNSSLVVLQISKVKLTDAGDYRCLVDHGGADYKQAHLKVEASYGNIKTNKKETHRDGEDTQIVLTCQSEGYPLAAVLWQADTNYNLSISGNTTHLLTPDGLFHVTSVLELTSKEYYNYSCIFWNEELNENTSAVFYVSGNI
uniref:Programmed cell death 1 ligand 2 n=1 Tax=Latimeria chalumnae TaxID=7897 RepID=H3ABM5_LATCH